MCCSAASSLGQKGRGGWRGRSDETKGRGRKKAKKGKEMQRRGGRDGSTVGEVLGDPEGEGGGGATVNEVAAVSGREQAAISRLSDLGGDV